MFKITVLCLLSLLTNIALAQDLSDADVKQWISSFSAIKSWSQKHDFKQAPLDRTALAKPGLQSPFATALNSNKTHESYKEFIDLLKSQGYSSGEEWAAVGDKITAAFIALKMAPHEQELKMKMDQIQSQMDNPLLNEQQKALLKSAIEMSSTSMDMANSATPEDKTVVQKHMAELQQVLDETKK